MRRIRSGQRRLRTTCPSSENLGYSEITARSCPSASIANGEDCMATLAAKFDTARLPTPDASWPSEARRSSGTGRRRSVTHADCRPATSLAPESRGSTAHGFPTVAATPEFRSLCPVSAVCTARLLR